MITQPHADERKFRDAVAGFVRGDFSASEPLFVERPDHPSRVCQVIEWFDQGRFHDAPVALAEAFTCACFLGYTKVAAYLLEHGVDPTAGIGTGLNAFHWAANRGQLETVRFLLAHKVPLNTRNMYGGTVLGCAKWSAVNEPKPAHKEIIALLEKAGATE